MKSKEKRILIFSQADVGLFFHVFVPVTAQRALPTIFFSGGKEEIRGQLATDHDSSSCGIKPSLKRILL